MIYNIFPFFDELDVLEIRLEELGPVVDCFVLMESTVTFSGHPKPLYYAEQRQRFKPWWGKIHHLICTDTPNGSPWEREAYQRNFLSHGLIGCKDRDLVILSDADEVPSASAVLANRKLDHGELAWFSMQHSWYWLNLVVDGNFGWARMFTFRTIRDLGGPEKAKFAPWTRCVGEAGWHFAYLGGVEAIARKLAAFSHQEYNQPPYNCSDYLWKCIQEGCSYIDGRKLRKLASLESLPAYVLANPYRFKKLIFNGG